MRLVFQSILKLWPTDRWRASTVVLAVSGGPDSVALLRSLDAINRQQAPHEQARLVVAHLNHHLRGVQSDHDQEFVRDLAGQLGLPAIFESLSPSDAQSGESHWRKARIAFLKKVARDFHAHWIATGATSDDSVETMIHHLLRGSGPAGLAGIRFERKLNENLSLIHPLIDLWKSDLISYLDSLGQSYRIDLSNQQNDFTRNRIRNECLPYLEKFVGNDRLKLRLRTACELIRQEHDAIEQLAEKWLHSSAIRWLDDHVQVDYSELSELPWPVLQCGLVRMWHRMDWPLQEISFLHWNRVKDWIDSARRCNHPKRMQLPGPIELKIARRIVHFQSTNARPQNNQPQS